MSDVSLEKLLEEYAASPAPELMERLVEGYLPLAHAVARKFAGRGVEVEDLEQMIGTDQFCHACFTGEYPTPIPTNTQKDRFEGKLSQREKKK